MTSSVYTALIVVIACALVMWIVGCAVHFVLQGKKLLRTVDIPVHLRCESCGYEWDASAEDVGTSWLQKSVYTTKTRREGLTLINERDYRRFSKRMTCPHCNERVWARVLNVNEVNSALRGTTIHTGLHHLGAMVAGGVIFLVLLAVVSGMAQAAGQRQAEALRAERYEELVERYQ